MIHLGVEYAGGMKERSRGRMTMGGRIPGGAVFWVGVLEDLSSDRRGGGVMVAFDGGFFWILRGIGFLTRRWSRAGFGLGFMSGTTKLLWVERCGFCGGYVASEWLERGLSACG